ncbi:hypothetical protein QE429_004463 [Bacillus sp. SORGH_AS 510]|uniref:hypothetical protein n=1 Tax=Bacillus sp. SORGH_AS_0510 TaxID=3041771 RepID=UPI00278048C4|nr:hypothetical protein [Bacillus sp. SORGH_AS_0510]MDQ1147636.1 hypothetical protein [Bacillus sp. SORGH_AS_0510]
MYKFFEDVVIRNEHSTIPYTWICSEKPNKTICIMLPGLGYSTQRPLFHYATGVCLNNNVDVLNINYNFVKNEKFRELTKVEREQWMYEDVKVVVETAVKDAGYEQCILLSKSIGTIPMAMEWTQETFLQNSVGIWLTPLLKEDRVYQALVETKLPSLCVIGDEDHHFIEGRLTALENNPLVSTVVIPKADHGLEIQENTSATIEAMKEIMLHVEAFIKKNKVG